MTQSLLRTLPVIAFVGLGSCYRYSHEPPGGDYVKFAELAPGYPAFAPGLGTVYVQPSTRPIGPYRSYDRNGKLIAMNAAQVTKEAAAANTALRQRANWW